MMHIFDILKDLRVINFFSSAKFQRFGSNIIISQRFNAG